MIHAHGRREICQAQLLLRAFVRARVGKLVGEHKGLERSNAAVEGAFRGFPGRGIAKFVCRYKFAGTTHRQSAADKSKNG
ncbi:hypothetical protein BKA66DRAFT_189981 [Pyrenochaeta sp. MPI-SDFR-AT-0127]|nr:hypothetical protein BKA66DRAFT_189981 [Pyrenochaeta sp. MPI-SDFR-AT-0127]